MKEKIQLVSQINDELKAYFSPKVLKLAKAMSQCGRKIYTNINLDSLSSFEYYIFDNGQINIEFQIYTGWGEYDDLDFSYTEAEWAEI